MPAARKSERLLSELVEALVQERIEEGESDIATMKFAQMELLGHGLGKELALGVQQGLVARHAQQMPRVFHCPTCQGQCPGETRPRRIHSLDGQVELSEIRCYCRKCRRSFFPSA